MATTRELNQINLFSYFVITLSKFVYRFDGRHIHDATFPEIDYDFIGIVEHIKFTVEHFYGSKKQWPINFVVFNSFFINSFSGTDSLGVIPSINQGRNNYPYQNSKCEIVHKNRNENHQNHHDNIRNGISV